MTQAAPLAADKWRKVSVELGGNEVKLKRQLHLRHGISIICSLIIGSGIYISPQSVLLSVRSGGLALIVWAVAGLSAMVQALVYAELGTTYPQSGESYIYLQRMYGPAIAFLYSWTHVMLIRPGSNAIKALLISEYLMQPLYTNCDPPHAALVLIAILFTVSFGVINSVKVRWAVAGQGYFALLSVCSLCAIVLFGVVNIVVYDQTSRLHDLFAGSCSCSAADLTNALVAGMYAYSGWTALNFMMDELVDPLRNLPLAICISLTIVTILYLLVNFCYLAILGRDEMIASSAVAVSFGRKAMGPFAFVSAYLICLSLISGSNCGLMATARIWHKASTDGQFPRIAGLLNVRFQSPMAAVVIQSSLTILLILVGDLNYIMMTISTAHLWFSVLLAVGIIYQRYRDPDRRRPIRLHVSLLLLNLLLLLLVVLLPLFVQPTTVLSGIAFCLLTGLPYYVIFVLWDPPLLHKYSDAFLVWFQVLSNSARSTSAASATGTPATGTPAMGTPATGTPATGTPATGTPATGTPATGTTT